ncbi:hypothetical protein KAH81_06935, partial [bacterium]|nr:hypothetical protein [bacterium]
MKAWKLAFLMILSINIAFAAVGWCGNIWPNSDSDQPLDSPIDVYFQIWKDGVTDSTGRGEGLAATIYWKEASSVVWDEIEMTYNGDVGNNDEYTGTIPAPSSVGDINYYCEVFDSTDTSTATGSDQNSVPLDESSPGVLHIVDVTSIDVTVTFQLDMTLEEITGDVTVGGSFNSWSSTENVLTDPDMDDVYVAEILFPAG